MSRILFGVAGEGLGHATRAEIIIKHLQQQGHSVKIITYHQGYWSLSKNKNFDVTKIFGLRFAHKNGDTTYTGTILTNLKKISSAKRTLKQLKQIVNTFKPEIIITDLEPFSPLFAYIYKIPLISVDNQHRIVKGKVDFDKKWIINYFINKLAVSTVAFKANAYIITSFFNFKITHPNTYIVPPILQKKFFQTTTSEKNHILIYDTTSNVTKITNLIKHLSSENFIIYGKNIQKKIGNCTFKKKSKSTFFEDLISSKAVIASAGMTLISEALQLKKPYLALPVKKRIEQLTNAYYLKKLGYGDYTENITKNDIINFIKNIPAYRKKLRHYHKQKNNDKLYKTLDKIIDEISKQRSLK